MAGTDTRVLRYVLVVDRGDPRRLTGLAVAAVFTEPGESTQRLGFFHLEEPPGDLPGRAVGSRIADMVDAMEAQVPVHVMLGVTLDGKRFAREIIMPAVGERLRALGSSREVSWETYAAHVRGGVREVGRKITLTERISALSVALELGTVVVPRSIALSEGVLRALKNFDPTSTVVEDGMDKWNAIPHEGIITAIAAAHTTLGEARLFTPRGGRGDAVLEESTRASVSFKRHPTIVVPEGYVETGVGSTISGTVAGGWGGGLGGRPR